MEDRKPILYLTTILLRIYKNIYIRHLTIQYFIRIQVEILCDGWTNGGVILNYSKPVGYYSIYKREYRRTYTGLKLK